MLSEEGPEILGIDVAICPIIYLLKGLEIMKLLITLQFLLQLFHNPI